MNLQLDYSLFAHLVLFIILWIALKRTLFVPVLDMLEARRDRTVGALERAAVVTASAEATREDCAQAVREARMKLAREAEEARKAGQGEHANVLATARAEAADELTRFRASLAEQVGQARKTLDAEAQTIAAQMLDRVTGRA